jgi:purine-nucleoside phosphorylase
MSDSKMFFRDMFFMGEHTLMPLLTRSPQCYENTLLEASQGKLPPYMIVVGDRCRVEKMASYLDDALLLDTHMQQNGLSKGRVCIAIGTFKGTPICVVEHSMGCACAEIIIREVLHDSCSVRTFRTDSYTYKAPSKYVIRYGSCGAINDPEVHAQSRGETQAFTDDSSNPLQANDISPQTATFKPFDIAVASHQIGLSGSDIQAVTGRLQFFGSDWQDEAIDHMRATGYRLVTAPSDPSIQRLRADLSTEISSTLYNNSSSLLQDEKDEALGRLLMSVHPFICSFINPCIHSFIPSTIHTSIHVLMLTIHSFTHLASHSSIHSSIYPTHV